MASRRTTPEEEDHGDVIEEEEEEEEEVIEEADEEALLGMQFGAPPGTLPRGWGARSEKTFDKEISLDHATPEDWQKFLDSLEEEEE